MKNKKADAVKLLQSGGKKGVSIEELRKKLKYKDFSGISKLMYLVRKDGYKVKYDKRTRIYWIEGKGAKVEATETEKTILPISSVKSGTKKGIVLDMLVERGKDGATAEELAAACGSKRDLVCFQVHSLRKTEGYKISNINGRYFLKSRNISASGTTPVSKSPVMTDNDELMSIIKDKELINGIRMLEPEDLEAYYNLLKNIIYFTKCAKNMISTAKLVGSMRKESFSL